MKRPLRKLISFSSAAAVLTNALAVTAFAAQTAEPVSDTSFSQMIMYQDRTVFVQTEGETPQLVVIGADGTKQTMPLEQNTSQLRLSSSERQFLGGTSTVYTFNYNDPVFLLAAQDNGCLIASLGEGEQTRYQLISDKTGKPISDTYDEIKRLSANLYQVTVSPAVPETVTVISDTDENGNVSQKTSRSYGSGLKLQGLIDNTGRVILEPSSGYVGFSPTKDEQNVLVGSNDGYWFIDLKGKAVSETYPRIESARLFDLYGSGEWWFPSETDFPAQMSTDIYRFTLENGNYAISLGKPKPSSQDFSEVQIVGKYDNSAYTSDKVQEYHICGTSADSGEKRWYAMDGTAAEELPRVYRLRLRDENGNRPFLCMEASDGTVIVDENENPLPEPVRADDGILTQTADRLVIKSENGYQLYNNKMELIGTYDDYFSGYVYLSGEDVHYAFKKGSTWELYDSYWQPIEGSFPADTDQRISRKKTELEYFDSNTSNDVYMGYLSQPDPENAPFTWELWDADMNTVRTLHIEASHGGTLETDVTVSNVRLKNGCAFCIETTEILPEDGPCTFKDYYVVNDKLDLLQVADTESAVGCGEYFSVKDPETSRWKLVDKEGSALIDKGYSEFRAYTQEETKGEKEYYYVGIYSTDFTVYDSSFNQLCNVIGTPVTDVLYKSAAKYGLYSLKTGALTKAEYLPADSRGEVGFFRTVYGQGYAPLAERVYPLSRGNTLSYFDGTGKLRREFDSTAAVEYHFDGATSAVYFNSQLILNDKTEDGTKGRTYVYDAVNDVVRYQQTGIYDRVAEYEDGYLLAVNASAEETSLWTNGDNYQYALVRAEDGAEIIPMTGDVKINSLNANAWNMIDLKYTYGTEPHGLSVNVRGTYYEGISNAVDIPIQDIDSEYAKQYGYDLAVKTDYGKYAALKDGFWCLANEEGNQVTEAKYARIYQIHEAMALAETVSQVEEEGYEWVKNPDTGDYEQEATTVTRNVIAGTLLSFAGKELFLSEPGFRYYTWHSADGKTYGVSLQDNAEPWSSAKYTFRGLFRQSDFNNSFAKQYGYDLAVQYGNVWVVQKNGLKGLVSADNEVLVPLQYADLMQYTPDENSLAIVSEADRKLLTEAPFSTPIVSLADGTMLAGFRKADGSIDAYIIKDDTAAKLKGDLNGDGMVSLKDVVVLRRSIAGGWNVTLDASKADLNGDGAVNLKDVVTLRRMIAGGFD